jgi:BMFP domain-containing protein YqiC
MEALLQRIEALEEKVTSLERAFAESQPAYINPKGGVKDE